MSAVVQTTPGFPPPSSSMACGPADPIIDPLLSYWAVRRGDRALPSRADIDPIDIPELLQHIGLVDVEGPPRRYRYRLVGSYMQTMFGENYQGRYLDEARHDRYRDFLNDLYTAAIDQRRPILSEAVFDYGTDRIVTIRRLILPLAEGNGAPVNMLLFANVFIAPDLPHHATPVLHLRMDGPFQSVFLTSIEETLRRALPVD
ncbi:PAS domain-containing protein [Thalassobaculum sp. OXR-137]|uniref:PAS domain-containing protein n=1 Tax=Thalassobaculum sp. OXR-137 TaxID=3100173 RepID=UPI002AC9E8BF|nr:PAS domain-containing protein [Thalassobaculum sp. OXR-137]WPZ34314.1 PAS domain-containing protein [Thalassobaculum sp. OXR-137]